MTHPSMPARNRFSLVLTLHPSTATTTTKAFQTSSSTSSSSPDTPSISFLTLSSPETQSPPSPLIFSPLSPSIVMDSTTDDALTRQRLLRKTRKPSLLFRLGDQDEDEATETTPASPTSPPSSGGSRSRRPRGTLSRSASQRDSPGSPNVYSPTYQLRRISSLLLPRPGLGHADGRRTPRTPRSPGETRSSSPTTTSWDFASSGNRPPLVPVVRVDAPPRASTSSRPSAIRTPAPTLALSPISPAFSDISFLSSNPPTPTIEEARTMRMAKLARHLGDAPPSDLVRHPSPPARIHRGKRRDNALRRLSLDMTSLLSPLLGTPNSGNTTSPEGETKLSPGLRRANSTLVGKHGHDNGPSSGEWLMGNKATKIEELPPRPMTRCEKSQHVRRAKKMTEVFGSEPPAALFRITRYSASDEALVSPQRLQRNSLSTCASGIHDHPADSELERRASYLTTTSTGSGGARSSVLTVISLSSAELKGARRHSSVHLTPPARSDSLRHTQGRTTPTSPWRPVQIDDEPPSPPPFTDIAVSSTEYTRAASALSMRAPTPAPEPVSPALAPNPEVAWARRRRAQKLTRFFGVDVREIEPALEATLPERSSTPAPSAFAAEPEQSEGVQRSWEDVDVRIVGPAAGNRRWKRGHDRTKTELVDARAALRGLKA